MQFPLMCDLISELKTRICELSIHKCEKRVTQITHSDVCFCTWVKTTKMLQEILHC